MNSIQTPAERKRRARIVAVVLGLSTTISVLLFMFAFVTRSKAERAAIEYEVKMHTLEAQLNSCVREASVARERAEAAMAEAERQRKLAERKK